MQRNKLEGNTDISGKKIIVQWKLNMHWIHICARVYVYFLSAAPKNSYKMLLQLGYKEITLSETHYLFVSANS